MHDGILDTQKTLSKEGGVDAVAEKIGLDMTTFKACTADDEQKKEIMADMTAGQELGVSGTPAFFINGIMLSGAQPFEAFKDIIDRELETAGQGG